MLFSQNCNCIYLGLLYTRFLFLNVLYQLSLLSCHLLQYFILFFIFFCNSFINYLWTKETVSTDSCLSLQYNGTIFFYGGDVLYLIFLIYAVTFQPGLCSVPIMIIFSYLFPHSTSPVLTISLFVSFSSFPFPNHTVGR